MMKDYNNTFNYETLDLSDEDIETEEEKGKRI